MLNQLNQANRVTTHRLINIVQNIKRLKYPAKEVERDRAYFL